MLNVTRGKESAKLKSKIVAQPITYQTIENCLCLKQKKRESGNERGIEKQTHSEDDYVERVR